VTDDGSRTRRVAAGSAAGAGAGSGAGANGTRRPGHGLVGMRERVALNGGTLDTRPRSVGGFEVTARLPLDPVAS
jgi:signal transduction histidine kinase